MTAPKLGGFEVRQAPRAEDSRNGWNRRARTGVIAYVEDASITVSSDDRVDTESAAESDASESLDSPEAAPPRAAGTQSFDEFFTASWPWAFKMAAFLTQNAAAGEEIAQEVLAAVYRGWGTIDQPEAYLRTSLVNASRNWQRRDRIQRTKLPLVADQERVDFAADHLADAIATLPYRQRAVLVLRYHFDLSEREIAETLGCRPGTVKSLASRALARLRKEIAK